LKHPKEFTVSVIGCFPGVEKLTGGGKRSLLLLGVALGPKSQENKSEPKLVLVGKKLIAPLCKQRGPSNLKDAFAGYLTLIVSITVSEQGQPLFTMSITL
jgi:hypothetical protein